MEDDIKDIFIHSEKEKEIRFNFSFKLLLGVSIGLTGFLSLGGIMYLIYGFASNLWVNTEANNFLYQILFYISMMMCFVTLISIAAIKKPFSKILVWCFMVIGSLFVIASFIFPKIEGYQCSNFTILEFGELTLIDGTIFIIGILGILFSRIIHYGFRYQKATDMTV